MQHPPNFKDWTNHQLGDRRILEYAGHNGKHALWKAQCKCGQIDIIPSKSIQQKRGMRCLECSKIRMRSVQKAASKHLRKHHIGDIIGCFKIIIEVTPNTTGKKRWLIECVNCYHQRITTVAHLCRTKKSVYCGRCHNRSQGESGLNKLLSTYQKSAATKQITFQLTIDYFKILTSGFCHYCGSEPQQKIGKNGWQIYIYNGIDRIDNDLDYTADNCVTCCKLCNYAKRDMTFNKFIEYLNQIVVYRTAKHETHCTN